MLKEWCKKQDFRPDGDHLPWDWVDEGKLLLFIKEEVASRPPRKGARVNAEKKRKAAAKLANGGKKRVKKSTAQGIRMEEEYDDTHIFDDGDDDDCSELLLMYNSVRSYVSAVNELWAHQTSKGLHNAPQPQRVAIKALKTSIVRGQHQRRRDEFVDRGLGTIKDGYVASQIPDLTHQVWTRGLGEHATEQHFRTWADFLFGNSMLFRLSNRLPMELPDLFSMPLPKEGRDGNVWCLVTVTDQGESLTSASLRFILPTTFIGKTNQHGRLEYGAALRHRDYRSCLVGALAVLFFWRWHCSGEPFPCFRTSQDWYNIKVLKRDDSHLEDKLSDSTASSWTHRLYKRSGIRSSKRSHCPRIFGAQGAEANGVSEDQVSPLRFVK